MDASWMSVATKTTEATPSVHRMEWKIVGETGFAGPADLPPQESPGTQSHTVTGLQGGTTYQAVEKLGSAAQPAAGPRPGRRKVTHRLGDRSSDLLSETSFCLSKGFFNSLIRRQASLPSDVKHLTGGWSELEQATTTGGLPAPGNLSVSALANGGFEVSFDRIADAGEYRIGRKRTSNLDSLSTETKGAFVHSFLPPDSDPLKSQVLPWAHAGRARGGTYDIRVRAAPADCASVNDRSNRSTVVEASLRLPRRRHWILGCGRRRTRDGRPQRRLERRNPAGS